MIRKKFRYSAVEIAAKTGTSAAIVRIWRNTKTLPKNPIICAKYLRAERLVVNSTSATRTKKISHAK